MLHDDECADGCARNCAHDLSAQEIRDARDWLKDCAWGDADEATFDELSNAEIVRGIRRHYAGGIAAFRLAGEAR